MPGVVTVGDTTKKIGDRKGDGEWQEATVAEGAKTVFCEGKPVAVLGAKLTAQKKEKDEPVMDEETGQQKVDSNGELVWKTEVVDRRGDLKIESGASTVFAEGTPMVGKGDSLSQGLEFETASETVFIE